MMQTFVRTATKSNDYFWMPQAPEIVIGKGDTLEKGEACLWESGEILYFAISTPTARTDDMGRPIRNLFLLMTDKAVEKEQLCALMVECLQSDVWVSDSSMPLNKEIEKLCGGEQAWEQKNKGGAAGAVKGFLNTLSPLLPAKASGPLQPKRKVFQRSDNTQRQSTAQELVALLRNKQDFLVGVVNKRSIGGMNRFMADLGADDRCPMVIVFSQDATISSPQDIPLPAPRQVGNSVDSFWSQIVTPTWLDRILLGVIIVLVGSLLSCCSRMVHFNRQHNHALRLSISTYSDNQMENTTVHLKSRRTSD